MVGVSGSVLKQAGYPGSEEVKEKDDEVGQQVLVREGDSVNDQIN